MNNVLALCFLICLLIIGFYFLNVGKLTGLFFVLYFGIVLIAFLAFYSIDRLKELDFKNLKLVLSDIKETKRDIYAKAEAVKKIGEEIAEMIAYNVAMANRWVSDEHIIDMFERRKKLEIFLKEIGTDDKRSKEILQSIDRMIINDLYNNLLEKAGYHRMKKKDNEQWFDQLGNDIKKYPNVKIDVKEIKEKLLEGGTNLNEISKELFDFEYFLENRAIRK